MYPFNRHNRLRESLSASIDGALSARDQTALESHLTGCESCRSELEALRAASEVLRSLPAATAPRSFALTPAMVRKPAAVPASYSPALNTVMRLSAASLAVALAAVMVVDRADLGGDGGSGSSDDAARTFESDAGGAPEMTTFDNLGDLEEAVEAPEATTSTAAGAGGPGIGGVPAPTGAAADDGEDRDAPSSSPPAATDAAFAESLDSQPTDDADREVSVAETDGGDGIGAVGVIEIVLALMLGTATGGAIALTAGRRRRGF